MEDKYMNLYGHKVNQLGRYFSKALNEGITEHGIYSSQWVVALYIHMNGECTQSELADYLYVEAPTITRTLSRMEKAGFIEKRIGTDKREKIINLTEKAMEAYPKWEAVSDSLEGKAIEGIDRAELEIFEKVVAKMMCNLKGDI